MTTITNAVWPLMLRISEKTCDLHFQALSEQLVDDQSSCSLFGKSHIWCVEKFKAVPNWAGKILKTQKWFNTKKRMSLIRAWSASVTIVGRLGAEAIPLSFIRFCRPVEDLKFTCKKWEPAAHLFEASEELQVFHVEFPSWPTNRHPLLTQDPFPRLYCSVAATATCARLKLLRPEHIFDLSKQLLSHSWSTTHKPETSPALTLATQPWFPHHTSSAAFRRQQNKYLDVNIDARFKIAG